MVALVEIQWRHCEGHSEPLALALAPQSLPNQRHSRLGWSLLSCMVRIMAHAGVHDMDRQRYMVITDILLRLGWNLRDFCDWMSLRGLELGQHYHWYWYQDTWAIKFYDDQVATAVTLALPEKHK